MATQIFTTNYEHEEFKTLLSEFISEAISFHKETAISHMVNGFAEIAIRGKEGLSDQHGIFQSSEILNWIIEY